MIRRVTVLGAGTMGHGIAHAALGRLGKKTDAGNDHGMATEGPRKDHRIGDARSTRAFRENLEDRRETTPARACLRVIHIL